MIKRTTIFLPMAAMFLAAMIALPATAQQQVVFKGTIQGQDAHTGMPNPTTVLLSTRCTGIGTLLGQLNLVQDVAINLTNFTDAGTASWVGANGDSIATSVVGSAAPGDTPDILKVTEIHTVTGGTGRFAGAQGSFTVERLHNGVTMLTSGSFYGGITAPGVARQ